MFDAKCYELAEYFLAGEDLPLTSANSLAQHIQDSVETWLQIECDHQDAEQCEEYPDPRAYPLADNH